jgi:hypothetical protein
MKLRLLPLLALCSPLFGCPAEYPKCDPTKCLEGNICVQDKCMLQCARHYDCPDGYDCRTVADQSVCVANNLPFEQGKFGYSCGVNGQVDCTGGFLCVGGAGDPSSYCTRQDCAADGDCPGEYFCGNRDIREPADGGDGPVKTVKACLKRTFCAPATSLVDCADVDAVFMTEAGGGGYCVKSCSGEDPNGCGLDNGCYQMGDGQFLCLPRSRSCAPTHEYCGRCASRADCPSGAICYYNAFSKDRYCAIDCPAAGNCPNTPGGQPSGCYTFADNVDRCIPLQPDPNTEPDAPIAGCYPPCPSTGCK